MQWDSSSTIRSQLRAIAEAKTDPPSPAEIEWLDLNSNPKRRKELSAWRASVLRRWNKSAAGLLAKLRYETGRKRK